MYCAFIHNDDFDYQLLILHRRLEGVREKEGTCPLRRSDGRGRKGRAPAAEAAERRASGPEWSRFDAQSLGERLAESVRRAAERQTNEFGFTFFIF